MFDNGSLSQTASSCESRKNELWYREIAAAITSGLRIAFLSFDQFAALINNHHCIIWLVAQVLCTLSMTTA